MQECLSGNGEQDVSLFNVLFGKHAIFGYCTLFTYVHLKKLISTVSVVNKYKSPFKGKSLAAIFEMPHRQIFQSFKCSSYTL